MKVLITGANGLLGSHVVRYLLDRNYTVRVLVRKNSDLRSLKGLDIEYYYGQVTERKDVYEAVENCDFVIHAAARTSQTPSSIKFYQKPNIDATHSVIEACKTFKVKRLVFVSTANCFGNGTKENPGNECSTFMPWLKKSGYAYSKTLAQTAVLNEVKGGDLNAVVVNPTFLIGERDYKPSSGQIFGHVLRKRIIFYPPGGKNFVDVEQAAKGVHSVMEKGANGECYLLAGENYSYLEFFKMVNRVAKQNTRFVPIPKWILLFAGTCGSMIETIFHVPVRLTYTNARMLCLGNYFTPAKAVSCLDFQIIPTKKSVEKAILWFNKNGYFNS